MRSLLVVALLLAMRGAAHADGVLIATWDKSSTLAIERITATGLTRLYATTFEGPRSWVWADARTLWTLDVRDGKTIVAVQVVDGKTVARRELTAATFGTKLEKLDPTWAVTTTGEAWLVQCLQRRNMSCLRETYVRIDGDEFVVSKKPPRNRASGGRKHEPQVSKKPPADFTASVTDGVMSCATPTASVRWPEDGNPLRDRPLKLAWITAPFALLRVEVAEETNGGPGRRRPLITYGSRWFLGCEQINDVRELAPNLWGVQHTIGEGWTLYVDGTQVGAVAGYWIDAFGA